MTDAEQTPEVEQKLARELEPGRHASPSEGVLQDLPPAEDDPAEA
ncbi:hypothetical protein [Candidatus Blastococcus massiliensis]|nr:hypothetical protein [Candidatus Blastococcus massiliensis]